MTPADIAAVSVGLALAAIAVSTVALLIAARAYRLSQSADLKASKPLTVVEAPKPAEPSREERIAWARGEIAACQGAELALSEHAAELPAAAMLAQYRANAARAKHLLRMFGIKA